MNKQLIARELVKLAKELLAAKWVPPSDFEKKLEKIGFDESQIALIFKNVSDYMTDAIPWEHFLKEIKCNDSTKRRHLSILLGSYKG